MIHIVVDSYGCSTARLDNLRDVYEVINDIVNELELKAIMPPQLVPYYYSKEPDDVGISAFVLLEGGHFTIHTFPQWQCYFADLLYDGYVNTEYLENILKREFPCGQFFTRNIDRDEVESADFQQHENDIGIYRRTDFGPHYMIKATLTHTPTIDEYMDMLDRLPYSVDMHPITRPYVLKSSPEDPKYLSGIVIIAESHIALHYCYATKKVFMDIFSCKMIDDEKYQKVREGLLNVPRDEVLIKRGRANEHRKVTQLSKHDKHSEWQKNIRPKK